MWMLKASVRVGSSIASEGPGIYFTFHNFSCVLMLYTVLLLTQARYYNFAATF
jgi:hypothetical protein